VRLARWLLTAPQMPFCTLVSDNPKILNFLHLLPWPNEEQGCVRRMIIKDAGFSTRNRKYRVCCGHFCGKYVAANFSRALKLAIHKVRDHKPATVVNSGGEILWDWSHNIPVWSPGPPMNHPDRCPRSQRTGTPVPTTPPATTICP